MCMTLWRDIPSILHGCQSLKVVKDTRKKWVDKIPQGVYICIYTKTRYQKSDYDDGKSKSF